MFTKIPILSISLQNYVFQILQVKMPIDTELLIELYRSEEGLCDSDNANYLNTDVCRQYLLRRGSFEFGSYGWYKKVLFLCYFIRSDNVNIAIKSTMNITVQISIGGTTTRKCAFLPVILLGYINTHTVAALI